MPLLWRSMETRGSVSLSCRQGSAARQFGRAGTGGLGSGAGQGEGHGGAFPGWLAAVSGQPTQVKLSIVWRR